MLTIDSLSGHFSNCVQELADIDPGKNNGRKTSTLNGIRYCNTEHDIYG